MNLIINNKIISEPIFNILKTLKSELTNFKLQDITDKGENIQVSCPVHKDGYEKHASCQVYCGDSNTLRYGTVHCFTCGYVDSLSGFIEKCFGDVEKGFGDKWLLSHYGNVFIEKPLDLPEIILNKKETKYLDESILDKFNFKNEYLTKRGISENIIEKFKIGYDPEFDSVIFPVYDEHNKLVMLTKRSTKGKRFSIDKNLNKPVYLLNFCLQEHKDPIYVCESQINALTLWTWGLPAVALIGTGSKYQYDILNKCGVRNYILCFDGDEAGDKGIRRFKQNINKECIVSIKKLPLGKDVNDLKKQEFLDLVTVL